MGDGAVLGRFVFQERQTWPSLDCRPEGEVETRARCKRMEVWRLGMPAFVCFGLLDELDMASRRPGMVMWRAE